MKMWVLVIAGSILAAPAFAQSTYVAGTIGAEIARTTSVKTEGSTFDGGSGEAFAWSIRVGTLIAPRFGVELEFWRPGAIDAGADGPIYAAGVQDGVVRGLRAEGIIGDGSLLPIISQRTEVRATTTSALAFARQSLGSRVDLVYLGGVGFSRVVHDIEFGVPRGLAAPGRPIGVSYSTSTTQYGVGPVVGAEARIGMTDHARLIAGLRLHGLGQGLFDGWLMRPSVGLAWTF
jgi:hypothetical protein